MASRYDSTSTGSKSLEPAPRLIAGHFAVDFSRPMLEGAGGRSAFAATGGQAHPANLMAVQVHRGWPIRAQTIQALGATGIQNLLVPLGDGPAQLPAGEGGYFVVSAAPPGPPLSAGLESWSENELIDQVMRPIAAVLSELQSHGATHRAIRPDNVFLGTRTGPVTMGCAWDAPAACHQPAVCEPPYSTVCDPAAHGEGTVADDVYALGVLMVWLSLGRDPMAGLDPETIVQRKLDLGSYAAVLGPNRLSPFISDLVRGMLADDPDHRPSPALLSDPNAARARRTAARPATRPQRPFELAGTAAWTPRVLAHAILRNPTSALEPLRSGSVEHWLRRVIGDAAMAGRLGEALTAPASVRVRGETYIAARTIMKAVAILDPLAPLIWRGAVFWPDGLGSALNNALQTQSTAARASALVEVAGSEVLETWFTSRLRRADQQSVQSLTRLYQKWLNSKPVEGGALRLSYALNPLAPCNSPLLVRGWATRLAELLPAMEAATSAPRPGHAALDRHIVSFIAVRRDERLDRDVGVALASMSVDDPLSALRLLAALQANSSIQSLPNIAGWLAEGLNAVARQYQSQSRRERIATQLSAAVQGGNLPAMLAILADPAELLSDAQGRLNAVKRMADIDAKLLDLAAGVPRRQQSGKRLGQDIAGAVGLLACGVVLANALLF